MLRSLKTATVYICTFETLEDSWHSPCQSILRSINLVKNEGGDNLCHELLDTLY